MTIKNLDLGLEVASSVQANVAKEENQGCGYRAPELHVVGKTIDLVQGNFGYTDRDLRYYWR